jgi:hypothetical protein
MRRIGQLLVEPHHQPRTECRHRALAVKTDLSGQRFFVPQLRFELGGVGVEMAATPRIGLSVGGFIVAREIDLRFDRLL